MERIKLSKSEKEVLRIIAEFKGNKPSTYPDHTFNAAAYSLQQKGLVKAKFLTTGAVWNISLTDLGKHYLCENPMLKNPVDWKFIASVVIPLAAVIVSIIALFVSCAAIRMR